RQGGAVMNFEFSDDALAIRDAASDYLASREVGAVTRAALEGEPAVDRTLWRDLAELGWLGAAIAEGHGGSELGGEALCMIAQEIGRAGEGLPFALSSVLVPIALQRHGSAQQQAQWLPRIADGTAVATVALQEGPGEPLPRAVAMQLDGERL